MKTYILIIIVLLPTYLIGQQNCNSKNCLKYGLALKKGNDEYKKGNYKNAVFQYLAAEVASRECGCNAPKIKSKIGKAISGLELQRKKAEQAQKEADRLAKQESERRKELEEKQANAKRLEALVRSIDDNNSAYQFLYKKGVYSFEKDEYKKALVCFANAEFLNRNDSVHNMIKYTQLGVKADAYFYDGYLEKAKQEYELLLLYKKDTTYCKEQLRKINKIQEDYDKKVGKNPDVLKQFNLYNSDLQILSTEIKELKSLESIILSNNQLNYLPPEIGQLSNLKILYINNNKLNYLPSEIGQLISLEKLNVADNSFKKLPQEIGQLSNLEELNLANNSLKTLPQEIGELSNLKILFVDNNNLSYLPSKIGQLSNLKILLIANNKLNYLSSEIGQLLNLNRLDLSYNSLNSLPVEIKKLKKLEKLNLVGNNFSEAERKKIEAWLKESAPDCEIEW